MRIVNKKTNVEFEVSPEIWEKMKKQELSRFYRLLDPDLEVKIKDFSVKKIMVQKQEFLKNPVTVKSGTETSIAEIKIKSKAKKKTKI